MSKIVFKPSGCNDLLDKTGLKELKRSISLMLNIKAKIGIYIAFKGELEILLERDNKVV